MNCYYLHVVVLIILPHPREREPTIECRPTPHLNLLLRSNIYSNMRPCVAALEKRSSNGWFMRTELRIVYIRLIVTCQTAVKLSLASFMLAIVTTPT